MAISSVLDIDELAHDVLLRAVGILNASKGMFVLQNEKSPISDILSMFNWGEEKFLLSKNIDVFKQMQNGNRGLILTDSHKTDLQIKLKEKNLDLIILNSLNDKGAGFGTDTNKITIINKNQEKTNFDLKEKSEVAQDILNHIMTEINV